MGEWKHRKDEPSDVRGLCVICNQKPQKSNGVGIYKPICTMCHKYRFQRSHRMFLKDSCEACGFVAKDKCQMDVYPLDGNSKNRSDDNFKTLCANCNRLRSFEIEKYLSCYPDQ